MKYFWQILLSVLLMTLAACGPSTPEPASDAEDSFTPEQSEEGLRIAATPTSDAAEAIEAAPAEPFMEAYPIPVPTPIIVDEGYPVPPPPPPPPPSGYDAYPAADAVWILFPVGEQCADAGRYPDLTTAVADLTAMGITIYESEVTDLIVCSACGCPTSAHYRVSIDANQLETAQALEWVAEE